MAAYSPSLCCFENPRAWISCHSRKHLQGLLQLYPCDIAVISAQIGIHKFPSLRQSRHNCIFGNGKYPTHLLIQRCAPWRTFAMSIDLENGTSLEPQGDSSNDTDETIPEDSTQRLLSEPPDSDALRSLLADAERSKLMKKLSEANQYNRFLKRQLQFKEDALINFKSELAILELELQGPPINESFRKTKIVENVALHGRGQQKRHHSLITLIGLAEEIAQSGIQQDLRKINGKYIQSYLLARLEAVHDKIKEQMEGVEAIKLKDVELFWYGMAEIDVTAPWAHPGFGQQVGTTVQVMGSFDGWSEGEYMSSEYSGGFAKFSTTLRLRPGKHEIKFLVDGEWHLSPELPVTGEAMELGANILIIVILFFQLRGVSCTVTADGWINIWRDYHSNVETVDFSARTQDGWEPPYPCMGSAYTGPVVGLAFGE
ncbi:hypothetical protein ACLOJK_000555 [Asimina triloba]